MKLARDKTAAWMTPRDFLTGIAEAADRAGLPVGRGKGASAKPRITMGQPLAVGHVSRCEYVDVVLAGPVTGAEFGRRLSAEGLVEAGTDGLPPNQA